MPNRKECYKDMKKYQITRNRQRKRYYKRTQIYSGCRRWTDNEDRAVLAREITDTELSYKIKRSVGAIQTRRMELKKKIKK